MIGCRGGWKVKIDFHLPPIKSQTSGILPAYQALVICFTFRSLNGGLSLIRPVRIFLLARILNPSPLPVFDRWIEIKLHCLIGAWNCFPSLLIEVLHGESEVSYVCVWGISLSVCGVYFCVQFLCCEFPSVCVFSRVVGPPRVMLLSVRSCRPSVETRGRRQRKAWKIHDNHAATLSTKA